MTDQIETQIWVDTEKKLLGAILQEPRNFRIAAERLTADDFYLSSDRAIYRCIEAMHEDGRGVDSLTLTIELTKLGQIEEIGASYVAHLDAGLPRFYRGIAQWVEIIANYSFTHKLRLENARFQEQLQQPGADVQTVLAEHRDRLAGIERSNTHAPSMPMFVDALDFVSAADETTDWLMEEFIPRAGNGIVGGDPKASKSFSGLDISMSMACGVPWMGFRVPKRVKTAIVSREDDPGLTRRRMKKLICGRADYARLPRDWLYINTRQQQADFEVTTPEHMNRLIDELGKFGAELVVLDVFRSLHHEDENDNTEVAKVLAKVTRIQTELKCATLLIHHIAKADNPNPFKGLRGASCIHGWMEFGMAVSVVNPEEKDRNRFIRKAEFESKESTARPIFYKIVESPDHATTKLERVDNPEQKPERSAKPVQFPSTRGGVR